MHDARYKEVEWLLDAVRFIPVAHNPRRPAYWHRRILSHDRVLLGKVLASALALHPYRAPAGISVRLRLDKCNEYLKQDR